LLKVAQGHPKTLSAFQPLRRLTVGRVLARKTVLTVIRIILSASFIIQPIKHITDIFQPNNPPKTSFVVGFFPDTLRRRLIAAVNLDIGVMGGAAFLPVLSYFFADK
jgi:hypothetical protein